MTAAPEDAVDRAFDAIVDRLHVHLDLEGVADLLVEHEFVDPAQAVRLRERALLHVGVLKSVRAARHRRVAWAAAASLLVLCAAGYLLLKRGDPPRRSLGPDPDPGNRVSALGLPNTSIPISEWTKDDLLNLMLSRAVIEETRFAAAFDRCRDERLAEAIPKAVLIAASQGTTSAGTERPSVAAALNLLHAFDLPVRVAAILEWGPQIGNAQAILTLHDQLHP